MKMRDSIGVPHSTERVQNYKDFRTLPNISNDICKKNMKLMHLLQVFMLFAIRNYADYSKYLWLLRPQ